VTNEQTTIDGFQLLNCISSGNDSQVWEVTEAGGRRFAMKVLLPEALEDRETVQTLKREGKAGQLFEHPNLVKIHDTVVTKQHAYLIMDFFRAPNLKTHIHSSLHEVHLRIDKLVEQLCLALAYMHDRGWLHRDVKPDNILLNKGSEVRLIDFSLAMRYSSGLGKLFAGKVKEIQGTKSYIAPETLLRKPPTPQTDMYSLGVTLYLALTGELPITGQSPTELLKNHLRVTPTTPSDVNPNITPEMDEWVMRLLAKKPANRFKTMDEAYSSIRAIKVFKEDITEVEKRREQEEQRILRDGVDAARRLDSRSDAQRTEMLGGQTVSTKPKPPQQHPAKPQKDTKPQTDTKQPAAQRSPQPSPQQHQQPQPGPGGYPPQPQPYPPGAAPFPPMAPPGTAPPPAGAHPPHYGAPPMPPYGPMPGYPAPQPMPGVPPQFPPQQHPQQQSPQQQQQQQQQQSQQQQQQQQQPQQSSQPASAPQGQPSAPSPPPPQQAPPRSPQQSPQQSPQPAPQPSQPASPPQEKSDSDDDDLPLMDELPPVL